MLIIIIFIFFVIIFIKKKEQFENYTLIENNILYDFNSNIYKYSILDNTLNKYKGILFMEPIKIKNINKKNDINLKKNCEKEYAKNQFNYLNCKNKCTFIDTIFKQACVKKCENLNSFDFNKCAENIQKSVLM